MDPLQIATAVLTVLAPFLMEGGQATAKKAGESLWSALEKRFQGRPAAETALVDLKQEPQDLDNQAALCKEVRKLVKADAGFRAEILDLLKAAEAASPGVTYTATVQDGAAAQGPGSTALGARAVQVGGNVGGDVIAGNKTAPVFDQRGQQVQTQTNVAGDLHGK
ncbi:MAG: hypothetical protein J7M17_02005 [Anaerolineae bacterium]|nr:hypothetical protein [Anaerolineae bacterium]